MRFLRRTVLSLLMAGVAFAARGQGTIVYRDPADIPVFGDAPIYYDFDLNADGVVDFQLRAVNGQFMAIPAGQNGVMALAETPPDLGGYVSALQAGDSISLSPIAPFQWMQGAEALQFGRYGPIFIECFNTGCYGYWQFHSGIAYMGVQFYIGSELHYGWVHLRVFSNGGYIQEWAYDTVAGQGILAGAVPEPSTWALLSLGLGVVLIRRSKRF